MTELTKMVIPVAGLGTRVLPASKVIPKEMLTVVDKPVIQYVIEEAVDAGFREIILVTRPGKESIENHFETHAELEAALEQKGKDALLAQVRDMLPSNVRLSSVFQHQPHGLIQFAAPGRGRYATRRGGRIARGAEAGHAVSVVQQGHRHCAAV